MARYRLVFKGELTGELPREACLKRLSKTFAEDPARLGMRLFSGRRVVVKRTDDHEVARRYLQTFEDAGARLILETEGVDFTPATAGRGASTEAPPKPASRPAPDPDARMTRKREVWRPPESEAPREAPPPTDAAQTKERLAVPDPGDRMVRREKRRRRRGKRR